MLPDPTASVPLVVGALTSSWVMTIGPSTEPLDCVFTNPLMSEFLMVTQGVEAEVVPLPTATYIFPVIIWALITVPHFRMVMGPVYFVSLTPAGTPVFDGPGNPATLPLDEPP